MSETPKRIEDEEQKIRIRAHEFWVAAGHEEGRDLDFWLDAEACLQGQGQISRRPIDLPGTLSFTAYGLPDPFPEARFELPTASDGPDLPFFAPIPTFDPRSPIEVTAREAIHRLPHLSLDPASLPHDSRLVAVQITVVISVLDRIARVADFAAWSAIKNDSSAAEPLTEQRDGLVQLKPEYLTALFDPQAHMKEVDEIEGLLRPSFREFSWVAFDLLDVTFGSKVRVRARPKARSWRHALWVAIIALGAAVPEHLLAGAVEETGKLILSHFLQQTSGESTSPGARGSVVPPSGEELDDLMRKIERSRKYDQEPRWV